MNFLQDILSEQFIYAIGWTLLHSLWQGALIGLLVSGLMVFMYKYTARLRYFIYSISIFLITGIAIITFFSAFHAYQPAKMELSNVYYAESSLVSMVGNGLEESGETPGPVTSFLNELSRYFKANIPLFVAVWLLGMLMMIIRFMGAYALVRRYRTQRVKPVMGQWENSFRQLAETLGVRNNVKLLESALAKVPMAIGYLKPIVLIPLGTLNGVPAQQMEAILAHELAHIRRRDYLMNMIQSFLEVVFFYHPVVWWLSKNIRIEREHICDDIAITITGNTMEFAKALSNIQEFSLGAHGLAAGLNGKSKNQLLNRIRRLTGKPKLHSGFNEGFIAASILVLSLIGMSAAAMITYPAEKANDPILTFSAPELVPTGMMTMENAIMILPDTNEKKQQAMQAKAAEDRVIIRGSEEELSEEQRAKLEELEKKIQKEMEAIEAEIEAEVEAFEAEVDRLGDMEALQEKYKQFQWDHQKHTEQMQKAIQEYQEAMANQWKTKNFRGAWTLPNTYFSHDSLMVFDGDSVVWAHTFPDNYIPYQDSLQELYLEAWEDNWADISDVWTEIEDRRVELDEQLRELYSQNYLKQIDNARELRQFFPEPHNVKPAPDVLVYEDYQMMPKTKRIIQNELLDDGLIEKGKEYLVMIGKKQMLINGEKQSRTVFKKYRGIVESAQEPWFIDENDEFKFYINH